MMPDLAEMTLRDSLIRLGEKRIVHFMMNQKAFASEMLQPVSYPACKMECSNDGRQVMSPWNAADFKLKRDQTR